MTDSIIYRLDRNYRIDFISGPWDDFARNNGGEKVLVRDVAGRSLWAFVRGDSTRMWLQALLERVRASGDPLERDYRCDSPQLQRFMRMRVAREDGQGLSMTHELLEARPRARPVHIYYWASEPEPGTTVRCSICGRIRVGARWRDAMPDDCGTGGLGVRYTVCASCQRVATELLPCVS